MLKGRYIPKGLYFISYINIMLKRDKLADDFLDKLIDLVENSNRILNIFNADVFRQQTEYIKSLMDDMKRDFDEMEKLINKA